MKYLFFLFLFLLAVPVSAHPIPPLAGTYSNFAYNESEGDITGTEITLIPSGSSGSYTYHALIQTAEGEPTAPQLVAVKFDGTVISFDFNFPGAGPVTFAGKITGTTLTGKVSGAHFSEVKLSLPLKPGYWQPPAGK